MMLDFFLKNNAETTHVAPIHELVLHDWCYM